MLEQTFDLSQPDFVKDPHPLRAEFRTATPFFYDPQWNQVYVTRYGDIALFLTDKRLGRKMNRLQLADVLSVVAPGSRLSIFNRHSTQHLPVRF